jgi:hypothetical protein
MHWRQFSAAPVSVAVPPPFHPDQRVRVRVDGDRVSKALADALGDTRTVGVVAAGIANPPVDLVGAIAVDYDYYFTQSDFPWAIVLSAQCSYNRYTVSQAGRISADARPELAGVDDGALQWQCAAWPVPKVSASAFASIASDIPTMLVDGALNPFSAREWLSTLQGGFSNATTLLFPTVGNHALVWGPPCLNDLRRHFLADPAQKLGAGSCVRHSPEIDFVTT